MKKINQKILSLPPYISTFWKNINTLYVKEVDHQKILVVVLNTGANVEIPHLSQKLLDEVFAAHEKYLEQNTEISTTTSKQHETGQARNFALPNGIPFQLGGLGNIEQMGGFLHHNPEQSQAPNLPQDMIQKIEAISKSLGIDFQQMNLPKAEPHCNCPYCQIARAIYLENQEPHKIEEEEISDEDLKFRDWNIKQKGKELYEVTNPIDQNEYYQVFLGNPIGCTCGEKNCEHIRTVLNN